jgi:hypothetical protein
MRILASVCLVGLLIVAFAAPTPVLAQEQPQEQQPQQQKPSQDDTGTNPANFTYDARFITEWDWLDGGGSLATNTFEFRAPLGRDLANLKGAGKGNLFYDMGARFGIRFRGRYSSLSLNNPGADPFGTSEVSGIGDFDARILALAYAKGRVLVATGLEAFFDTATNDALGAETTSLGPQVFVGFVGALGGNSLFVPGYQYVFDVAGDGPKVSQSRIDLYFVWLLAQSKYWFIANPQIILDHENKKEVMTVEAELGYMIGPLPGASVYVRPGVGFGDVKPYSWNLELGLKFIWR